MSTAAIAAGVAGGQHVLGGAFSIAESVQRERELRIQRRLERNLQRERERDLRREARLLLARGRASAAASGVQAAGSVLDVIADNAGELELNVLRSRFESQLRQRSLDFAERMARFGIFRSIFGGGAAAGGAVARESFAQRRETPFAQRRETPFARSSTRFVFSGSASRTGRTAGVSNPRLIGSGGGLFDRSEFTF